MLERAARVLPLIVVVASACAANPPAPTVVAPARADSTLGPGDPFGGLVYGEGDLSGKYRIAEDGTINFPFVGSDPGRGQAAERDRGSDPGGPRPEADPA